jgi:hypothetical protein
MKNKWILRVACCALAASGTLSAHSAPPADSPPQGSQPDNKTLIIPSDVASEARARLSFAPMWMPVPRFAGDPDAKGILLPPCACYAIIWQPQWQKELGISAEQREKLLAIHAKALNDAEKLAEQLKKLSPAEREAEVKSWAGKSSPSRQQLDREIRKQIEAVLTPPELQAVKDYSFPEYAVGLLYDANVRQEIGFSPEQEDRLRRLAKQRLARFQEEYLKQAEKVWGLLSARQQSELVEVIKHQGSTSSVLSIAFENGFDVDSMGLSYPMLAEAPVRERLELKPEQEKQLQAVIADVAAWAKKARQEVPRPESDHHDKSEVEAILTPQQLATLNEINFRRQVVLAVGYPKKQEMIGMTNPQKVDLQRIYKETHEQLYPIDREMLGRALEIVTPVQREQLSAGIDRRIGGK